MPLCDLNRVCLPGPARRIISSPCVAVSSDVCMYACLRDGLRRPSADDRHGSPRVALHASLISESQRDPPSEIGHRRGRGGINAAAGGFRARKQSRASQLRHRAPAGFCIPGLEWGGRVAVSLERDVREASIVVVRPDRWDAHRARVVKAGCGERRGALVFGCSSGVCISVFGFLLKKVAVRTAVAVGGGLELYTPL
ncbi:hypothetical protein OH77DRAFT_104953 [Trametes cingulata]|nr:hypothetical protein OH77DRAFT_104953 [Trametes cingulata]